MATSGDAAYFTAIINAINTYATSMNTFTAAAAANAQAALNTALTNATAAWVASQKYEGE